MTEEHILNGPEIYGQISEDSLGLQIYESLINNDDNQPAFIHAETSDEISFPYLLKISCQLAESLRNAGYKQNDVLSVCSENSLYFFYPVIAALYNGIIVAPLNTTYTEGELIHSTGITKPKIIFCSKRVLPNFIKLRSKVSYIERIIVLDVQDKKTTTLPKGVETLTSFIADHSDKYFDEYSFRPLALNTHEQLAVVLCSSGTTGLPKGVMTTHHNINVRWNHMNDPRISTDMSPNISQFGLLPFFHGYGFMVCLGNISRGNTIIVVPHFEEKLFLGTIEKFRVTHLCLVPPIMVFLSKSPTVLKYDLTSVKEITCGAAPLSKQTHILVNKRFQNTSIRQGYGMTETTLATTITPNGNHKDGSSGQLVSGMQCIIRDPETGRNLGLNQVGELCFKGGLIMKGYFGNEKATRDTFTKDGWLKTGDMAYIDSEGFFFIVDRLKELIKYKGFQVPPAELEALLLTHPNIKDCGVIGIPDERAGELPFAFVVRDVGSKITEKEIEDFVTSKVSYAKRLHGGVAFLKEIPKNASGKILRRELREIAKKSKSKL